MASVPLAHGSPVPAVAPMEAERMAREAKALRSMLTIAAQADGSAHRGKEAAGLRCERKRRDHHIPERCVLY